MRENDVREEIWRTLTSNANPVTGILVLFDYKEETSLANIICNSF